MRLQILNIFLLLLLLVSCRKDNPYKDLKTEYIIIVVIDGARYSETWGEPSHAYIPMQSSISSQGILFENFTNSGKTSTIPGHASIVTGVNQEINNSGLELPSNPSLFQVWRKETGASASATWLICSKGKLEVIANTSDENWNNQYMPSTNCGIGGLGATSGYREDSLTFVESMNILNEHHPNLVLINFREPDYSAHQNNWPAYLEGISKTDEYVATLWDFIENDPIYKGKTALLITNDHGRHTNGNGNGYAGHGDDCSGCRAISLFALGPDFQGGQVITAAYDQRDLASTVAYMLRFRMPKSDGGVIRELFY
ncbi:MAG: hypothetical protein ACI865_000648 [Flavobacteriaceae bacterium]|jgi:hypothetical protein